MTPESYVYRNIVFYKPVTPAGVELNLCKIIPFYR